MPPKKGAAAGEDGQEEDVSCEKFMYYYRKNCGILACEVNKKIKQMYETEWQEEQKPISKIHLWEDIGWQGVKAIVDAMLQVKYQHLTSIRLWRAKC